MKLVLVALSTVIVISAGLSLKPSPRRDVIIPRRVEFPDRDVHDARQAGTRTVPRKNIERHRAVKQSTENPPEEAPAQLRVSDTRRKKVKQVATRENESVTRVTTDGGRKLSTKIVHVKEPYVVHVEKPYPVYIEKPIIVEKHLPMHLYITKKETKHHKHR
ncbi:uncharacterized protein LOC128727607 [Anopheles nili]|uniref:uncharacterized protein LOC128727607 n=1 Tax=Anopheles nili TaxID=185578 RepID=UPI00237BC2DF|nr:uncharacterized protein LOC128727607 [Anopheles nili]